MRQWKQLFAAGTIALLLAWNAPLQRIIASTHASGAASAPTVMASAPVEVPEPVTIILFGTGLAALAAAATVKRQH